jgi:hypothetical protein
LLDDTGDWAGEDADDADGFEESVGDLDARRESIDNSCDSMGITF